MRQFPRVEPLRVFEPRERERAIQSPSSPRAFDVTHYRWPTEPIEWWRIQRAVCPRQAWVCPSQLWVWPRRGHVLHGQVFGDVALGDPSVTAPRECTGRAASGLQTWSEKELFGESYSIPEQLFGERYSSRGYSSCKTLVIFT